MVFNRLQYVIVQFPASIIPGVTHITLDILLSLFVIVIVTVYVISRQYGVWVLYCWILVNILTLIVNLSIHLANKEILILNWVIVEYSTVARPGMY